MNKKEIYFQLEELEHILIKYAKRCDTLQQRIDKALNYIYINYGLLDKYQIEILEDILKGDSDVD